jgi:hypothetical protein
MIHVNSLHCHHLGGLKTIIIFVNNEHLFCVLFHFSFIYKYTHSTLYTLLSMIKDIKISFFVCRKKRKVSHEIKSNDMSKRIFFHQNYLQWSPSHRCCFSIPCLREWLYRCHLYCVVNKRKTSEVKKMFGRCMTTTTNLLIHSQYFLYVKCLSKEKIFVSLKLSALFRYLYLLHHIYFDDERWTNIFHHWSWWDFLLKGCKIFVFFHKKCLQAQEEVYFLFTIFVHFR